MKKNTKVLVLAGLGVVTLVGGTFAYYSASQTFTNPFDTSSYGTVVTEKFNVTEGQDWEPGAKVDKEVYATNTGEGKVWARVFFDEKWLRGGATQIAWNSKDGNFNVAEPAAGKKPVAGEDYQPGTDDKSAYVGDKDGIINSDTGSVVYKELTNLGSGLGKWQYCDEDGYYYYTSALNPKEQTVKLLDSVTLASDTDMGRFYDVFAYLVVPELADSDTIPTYQLDADDDKDGVQYLKDSVAYTWEEVAAEDDLPAPMAKPADDATEEEKAAYKAYLDKYTDKDVFIYKENKLNDRFPGYADAEYELSVTVEFLQADDEAAANAGWKFTPAKDSVQD